MALPAGGGGPPGLAGGADHLPRRLSSPTRRLCSCPVAVDPRVHAGCSASVFLLLQHLSSPPPHPATVLPIPTPVSPPTGRGRRDCWLSCPHRLGGVNCITVKRHDEPRCLPGQEHAGEGGLISLQFRGWWRHGVKTAMLGVERGQGMEGAREGAHSGLAAPFFNVTFGQALATVLSRL